MDTWARKMGTPGKSARKIKSSMHVDICVIKIYRYEWIHFPAPVSVLTLSFRHYKQCTFENISRERK